MRDYLREHKQAFEPALVEVLAEAFNNAWAILKRDPALGGPEGTIKRDELAKAIVELAVAGEIDVDRLTGKALARFIPRSPETPGNTGR